MNEVSVVVIAQDEERDIERALRSAAWADEVVVLDGGSRDKTREIAERHARRVESRAFTNFAEQKNHAISLSTCPWVFSLDADEEISSELAREILTAVRGPHAAYRVRRVSEIFGRRMKGCGTQSDRPVRLFRRDRARFVQPVHEYLQVDGSVGSLAGELRHVPYQSISDHVTKMNRYTSMEAGRFAALRLRSGSWRRSVEPAAMWLRRYIVQAGFWDGTAGFVYSGLSAYYSFLKHAKRWEISR